MRTSLVLTAIGADRPGLVELLADTVAAHGGNWEASHMARLGGRFAGILLVTFPEERAAELRTALSELAAQGLEVVVEDGSVADPKAEDPPLQQLKLELTGSDHPGIIRDLAHLLARHSVNVDELETACTEAPMAGGAIFHMTATLTVPASVTADLLCAGLEDVAQHLMVDVQLEKADS